MTQGTSSDTTTPDLDLDAILAAKPMQPRPGRSPLTAEQRAEQARRASAAGNMAVAAMRRLHPDEFSALYQQAKAKIDAERGPL
jgi:hypothetical protein